MVRRRTPVLRTGALLVICVSFAIAPACKGSPTNPSGGDASPALNGTWTGTITRQSPTATGTLRMNLKDTGIEASGNLSGSWSATLPDGTSNKGNVSGSTRTTTNGPLFMAVTLSSDLKDQCGYSASGTLAASTIAGVYLALQSNCTSANLGANGGDFRVTR